MIAKTLRFGVCLWGLAMLLGCGGSGSLRAAPTQPAESPSELVSDGRYRMGTLLEITLVSSNASAARAAIEETFEEVARLETIVSRYDPHSELSGLVAQAGEGPVAVGEALRQLLAFSVEAHGRTSGAFDVTAAPAIQLWKRARLSGRLPTAQALVEARARIGIGGISLGGGGVALAAGTDVDLGGVAKGWALDRVVPDLLLRSAAIDGSAALLASFGQSSIMARGAPPGSEGWRLLVRSPEGGIAGQVRLRDRALSISSSHSQSDRVEGRRVGHVIDPRSASPVPHSIQAAVVAPSCAEAEIWSTALLVLGRREGLRRIEALRGTEALVIDASGGSYASSGWAEATGYRSLDRELGQGAAVEH